MTYYMFAFFPGIGDPAER